MPDGEDVVSQSAADPGAYRHHAVFVSFAVDHDEAPVKVDVIKPDSGNLGPSYARVVQKLQDDPIPIAPVGVSVRSSHELSYVRFVQDGARQAAGLFGKAYPLAGIMRQVVMLFQVAGKPLDCGKPSFLAARRQRPSFGGEGKGQLLLILLDYFPRQLFKAGCLGFLQELRELLQPAFCVFHRMRRKAPRLQVFQVFRQESCYFHWGGSPRGFS